MTFTLRSISKRTSVLSTKHIVVVTVILYGIFILHLQLIHTCNNEDKVYITKSSRPKVVFLAERIDLRIFLHSKYFFQILNVIIQAANQKLIFSAGIKLQQSKRQRKYKLEFHCLVLKWNYQENVAAYV